MKLTAVVESAWNQEVFCHGQISNEAKRAIYVNHTIEPSG